uniref:Uncharacterized protein n=1 Tax=Tanacetum cinerariifolium TaxID=118510 RepID=A0A6L2M7I8_TANCI|nr:hypothetical protein [Tanacetum cinerariifolium]
MLQEYLQNEHYALWEVIEFGDSYKAPPEEISKGPTSESSARKKGRTVAITMEDMQKRRNDVKARTTLLLALPDEHQLRFNNSGKGKVRTASGLTASIQVSTASTDVVAASLSHEIICAYIANQSNGSQIKYEDISQIDEDDIKKIDTKYNMALLSMRADRFWKKTSKKITIQGSDVAANEKENHALVADDEVPTEFALLAKSSSSSDKKVYDDSYCSKSCRKNIENLNTKINKLNEELSDCETDLYNYKRGLSQVEARLIKFKENEVKFCERIRVLERDVEIRDNKIEYLKNELEQVKKEKESLDNKLTGFGNASKDLHNLLGSQRSDKNKGVLDIVQPTPSIDASKCNKSKLQSSNFSVFEHGESTGSIMSKPMIKFVKEADCPRVIKINNNENARKSTMKYAEMYRNISKGPKTREKLLRPQLVGFRDLNKILLNKVQIAMWNPQNNIDDKGYWDSGCSWHMTGNISYLSEYEPYDGGYVSFGHGGGKITGKGIIKTWRICVSVGISSLPDAELFENLSLMGYNILPSQRSVPLFASMIVIQGEGLANPTEPHHTPSPQEHQSPQSGYSPQHDSPALSHQTIIHEPIPHDLQAPIETLTPRRLTKKAIRIAQSKVLSPDADEPASLLRDDRHGEAFLTVSSLDAGQYTVNIVMTSAMSYESSPRVHSLDADEGSMQQRLHELMELCTSLQRTKKEDVKSLFKRMLQSQGGIIDIKEELGADKSTEKGSNDTEEMVNVLSSIKAANISSSGGATFQLLVFSLLMFFQLLMFPLLVEVFPLLLQFLLLPVWQHHIQEGQEVAREMEEEFTRENQRLSEQAARDSEIARIHAKEELKLTIEGLDRSNEVIAKHLSEYEQAKADLFVGEKIELISELVKYKDFLVEILKYQAQQSKPSSKKEQRKFYMSVLKSHAGWKTEHFRGMTLEKREYWKIIRLGGHTGAYHFFIDMLKKFDREDLYQLWILVKETYIIKQSTRDKEKELWVELKRLFKPDCEDQLWTYHQAFMHDPLDWKLYDTCGVHHVYTKKNQEIFMLVEKDYPLRKGLAIVMIIEDGSSVDESGEVKSCTIIATIYDFGVTDRKSFPSLLSVTALEKEVVELKKGDSLNTQVTTLVDEHLDSRLGATRDEFMNYLLASITARMTEQVKSQLPQILPKEVSNFSPSMIKSMVTESLENAVLTKESSQPKSIYEAAALLTEFELKKILIDEMDESQSNLTATDHRECYDGLIKSLEMEKSLLSTYDKVYSLKRSRKDKDKDKDPSAGSD